MEYEVHEAAQVFPLMLDYELDALASDIQEHGLLEPILLYEGKILDGRNRLRACELVGVEPRFEDVVVTDGFHPLEFVVSKNLHRRHLSPAQKAVVALSLLPHLTEEAAKRRSEGGKIGGPVGARSRWHPDEVSNNSSVSLPDRGTAAEKAARLAGAGIAAVNSAIAIQKRDPSIIEKMRSGEYNVAQARRAVGMAGAHGAKDLHVPGHSKDRSGRETPIYYGKGDKWKEVLGPLMRYLAAWERRGYEFRHVNPKEARRRLALLEEVTARLNGVQKDLEQRAHSATLTVKKG